MQRMLLSNHVHAPQSVCSMSCRLRALLSCGHLQGVRPHDSVGMPFDTVGDEMCGRWMGAGHV